MKYATFQKFICTIYKRIQGHFKLVLIAAQCSCSCDDSRNIPSAPMTHHFLNRYTQHQLEKFNKISRPTNYEDTINWISSGFSPRNQRNFRAPVPVCERSTRSLQLRCAFFLLQYTRMHACMHMHTTCPLRCAIYIRKESFSDSPNYTRNYSVLRLQLVRAMNNSCAF